MKKNSRALLILILILVVCSLFMPLSINYTGQSKISSYAQLNRYVSLSRLDSISSQNFVYYNKSKAGFVFNGELNLKQGIQNGIVVIGNYFRNIITGTILDYLHGFKNISSELKMIWVFFGIFFELAKNILFSSLELVVVMVILLFQAINSYIYVLSYLLTILFIIGITSFLKKN